MITKDQIIKALYNSAKKTETTKGVEINYLFADQADAILNLLQAEVSLSNEQKTYLIKKLQEHWDIAGDSRHWEGIKMAKRVIIKM